MAFKELAKLCSMHMPNTEERGLTKLGTLLRAVDLIPMLEEQVFFFINYKKKQNLLFIFYINNKQ